MTEFHPALSVSVEEDLLPLSAILHQRGVVHRIFEENGKQVLMVQHAAQAADVKSLYRAWRAGEVRIELARQGRRPPLTGVVAWRGVPVTIGLILCSIAGFLLFFL